MNTTSSSGLDSSSIILITTTVLTALISLADLAVNAYVAHKKRHFQSSCCKGFCACMYDSEDQEGEHTGNV